MLYRSTILACLTLLFLSFTNKKNNHHVLNRFHTKIDSIQYQLLINHISSERDSLKQLYLNDKTSLKKTGSFLISSYYKIIVPQWLGTKWEFYGKTEVPGYNNSIACGYFVVNSLKHLGINLEDPVGMAENYSAYMISTLCDTSYKTKTAHDILKIVNQHPDDIWIVGLSNHSGILIKENGRVHFIHSSYIDPVAVVDELAETSVAFKNSKIYVAGNLFMNNSLTKKWLLNEKVKFIKKF